jgi:hypothetical protein
MPANPDSLTVVPCPISRPPDIVGPAHVITRAVRAITPIIRSVSRMRAVIPVILITSDCTEHNSKRSKERKHSPFPYHFRSVSGGDRFLLRARTDVCSHV